MLLNTERKYYADLGKYNKLKKLYKNSQGVPNKINSEEINSLIKYLSELKNGKSKNNNSSNSSV